LSQKVLNDVWRGEDFLETGAKVILIVLEPEVGAHFRREHTVFGGEESVHVSVRLN